MNSSKQISARTARLNSLILGHGATLPDGSDGFDIPLETAVSREGLLDSLLVLYDECSKDVIKKKDKNVADFVAKYRPIIKETRTLRVNVADFDVKNLIGKGYFGEVHLVSERHTGEVYAMKTMRKSIVTATQIREERDIMASRRSDWLTSLQYAFQDQECLYLVMEYLPGGDLLSLMIRTGVFDEELAQFYMAELTEALHALHSIGYVHRDIKPENILLDRFGHLKLADFGNATAINKDGSVTSMTPVGTPDYIAPELLQTLSTTSRTSGNHDVTCDFWSMGIIGYEFVTESTPFHDENVNDTYSKIVAHCEGRFTKKLEYPAHVSVTSHYRDLIDRLVTKVSNRMGYAEIKRHPFFSDVNWDKLRYRIPPLIPTVSSEDDTSNFEDVDKSLKRNAFSSKPTYPISKVNDFSGQNLPFLGYTYVYEESDPAGNYRDTDEHMASARLSQKIKEQDRLIKEHNEELHRLQRDLLERDRKLATLNAHSKIYGDTKKEMENLQELLKTKTAELAAAKTDIKTLRNRLKIEEEQRLKNDATIADLLKQTYKNQLMADKEEYDRNHQQLVLTYDTKLAEHRQKWKSEKELRNRHEEEIRVLRSRIQEYEHTAKNNEQQNAKFVDNLKRRMTIQLEEARQVSDKMSEEMQRKCCDLKKEINKLQQEQQSVTSSANSSQRSSSLFSVAEPEFKSAHSSIQDLPATAQVEDQLRNDLQRARESEDLQRKRADGLEEVVARLEKIIDQFKASGGPSTTTATSVRVSGGGARTSGSGGTTSQLLERQNERLEDKLSAIREQSILDKQSARTANLALWKVEKELERAKLDASILGRRVEQADERTVRVRKEKEEVEFRAKQTLETLAGREKQIEDLKVDIQQLKDELRRERYTRETADRGRLAEKAELIASTTKLGECKEELNDALEANKELEQKLAVVTKNFNMLKGACSITETQLTELEILLEKEQRKNKENQEKIEGLFKQMKEKDGEVSKLRQELHHERTSKTLSESKSSQLLGEYDELRNKFEDLQKQMVDQQRELIEKTTSLFEVQERIEMLNLDTSNLQKVVSNYEHEHHILKEENSKILTDLFLAKEHITKQNNDIKDYKNHINQLNHELDHVKSVLTEQKTFYSERDIKSEATLAQHKKLIDYLQSRVEESAHKKKKTLADKIFGTSGHDRKENVPPPNPIIVENTTSYKKLQDELQKERQRTNQLKEQLLRAKTDMITMQGSIRKSLNNEENEIVKEKRRSSRSPQKPLNKQQQQQPEPPKPQPTGKAHVFDMTLETPSSKNPVQLCSVCDRHILAGHPYWKCTVCARNVHRKCRSGAGEDCRGHDGDLDSLANELVEQGAGAGTSDTESLQDRASLAPSELSTAEEGATTTGGFGVSVEYKTITDDGEETEEGSEGNQYVGELLFKTKRVEPKLTINDVYDVSEAVVLLGCENGLYSYNVDTCDLVPIKGITKVKSFSISQQVPKAIIIGNDGEYLYQCDLRHLQSRALAGSCLSPKLDTFVLDLSIANRTHSERWHMVRMMDEIPSQQLTDAIAIAATSSRIVILKFDTTLGRFKPVRGLDTVRPVSSVLFTKHTAIVSSDKFFEIDLTTFGAEEFLDMSDASLRDIRSCTPMAAFKVNSQEFLLCFKEVGIFVDEFGNRSRPDNINWMQEPTDFKYRDSCLFLAHSDCVQVMYVSKSYTKELERKEAAEERRAFINLNAPRLLAFQDFARTCVYVSCEYRGSNEQEIIKLDGYKALQSTSPNGISNSMETLSSLASYPTTVTQSNETLDGLGKAV
ncbi:hypothetical protein quinque_003979 [Culex quinquefasciatus]